jgi:pyruvate,water dikinase
MILFFGDVAGADRHQVGGKGYQLARLFQAGFPVPPGFIITADAFRAFCRAANLDGLFAEMMGGGDLRAVSESLQAGSDEAELAPALVAAIRDAHLSLGKKKVVVRSSALVEDGEEVSFAGQYESILNVSDEEELLAAVRRCWASLWSPGALSYLRDMIPHACIPRMAVVVQEMVQVSQAGVVFTLDPTGGFDDVVIVEAVDGSGTLLVSGEVTPYRHVVRKRDGGIESENGGLDRGRLAAVFELAQQVESWARQPQDLEWAYDQAGSLRLLQARPISQSARAQPIVRWTRDNVGEVIPGPVTPLSWSVLDPLGNHSFVRVLRRLRVSDVPTEGMFGRFYGRVYFNRTLFEAVMSRFYPSCVGWRAFPRLLRTFARAGLLLHSLPGESQEAMESISAQFLQDGCLPLENGLQGDALDQLKVWQQLEMSAMQVHLAATVMAQLLYEVLNKVLNRRCDGRITAAMLTGELTRIQSAEAGERLRTLARLIRRDDELRSLLLTAPPGDLSSHLSKTEAGRALWRRIEDFLQEYGHCAVEEFELAMPRWRDDPTMVLSALQAQVQAAEVEKKAAPGEAKQRNIAEVEKRLTWPELMVFRRLLEQTETYTAIRENLKYHLIIAHSQMRDLFLALAERLVAAGWLADREDIFHLTVDEVDALVRGALTPDEAADRVGLRRREWRAVQNIIPPSAFDQLSNGRLRPVHPSPSANADVPLLQGLAASPGSYVGPARVLRDVRGGAFLEPGEVLVASAISPGWSPLLAMAGALVTEIGGTLSHCAIISREYGLPAVLNIANATRHIETGRLVHVDGYTGTVRLLGEEE